jgi:hypothetical protein
MIDLHEIIRQLEIATLALRTIQAQMPPVPKRPEMKPEPTEQAVEIGMRKSKPVGDLPPERKVG